MTQQKWEGNAVLSPEALTTVRELLVCCMEHPMGSPHVAAKALALAMAVGQAQEQLWEQQAQDEISASLLGKELFGAFRETWDALLDVIPYLSKDQKNELKGHMEDLFEEWAKAEMETTTDVENAKVAIMKKVQGRKGSFTLQKIPKDATKIDGLESFVRKVLEDMFGSLVQNLPLVVRIQQENFIARRVKEFVVEYDE